MKASVYAVFALIAASMSLVPVSAKAGLEELSSTDVALASFEGEGIPTAIVTMEAYDYLTAGMSYEDVEAEVGRAGWEVGRVDVPDGSSIVVYRWLNRGGATLSVTFQDDELVAKRQHGLR